MKTVAIIPAGGAGRRMESAVPKQYLLLDGLPIVIRTLSLFQASPRIDEILLVVPSPDVFPLQAMIETQYHLPKVSRVLAGGEERQHSVRNALQALSAEHEIVVIHDAVRPFLAAELIERAIEGAVAWQAVAVGVPARDTVKRVGSDLLVGETFNRDEIWLAQTPQAFQRQVIERAYATAYADGFLGTDDASLVERIGVGVKMIRGSEDNIKITTGDDLLIGEALMRERRT